MSLVVVRGPRRSGCTTLARAIALERNAPVAETIADALPLLATHAVVVVDNSGEEDPLLRHLPAHVILCPLSRL